ncbi:hypothetical protein AsFPU3_1215 [Aphanothece sacrum FPU3]|nr:hypothetical protein AsFPU3_1215 [Aphanothece sacrum FPU3]
MITTTLFHEGKSVRAENAPLTTAAAQSDLEAIPKAVTESELPNWNEENPLADAESEVEVPVFSLEKEIAAESNSSPAVVPSEVPPTPQPEGEGSPPPRLKHLHQTPLNQNPPQEKFLVQLKNLYYRQEKPHQVQNHES